MLHPDRLWWQECCATPNQSERPGIMQRACDIRQLPHELKTLVTRSHIRRQPMSSTFPAMLIIPLTSPAKEHLHGVPATVHV